ncbi:MAG: PEPxxWA-CTERM sorting domain-containing protein [Pseudomonadota bacterium]
MSVTAASSATSVRLKRGGAVALLAVALAGALSVATLSNPRFVHAVGEGLSESIQGVKTVAAMLAERSPGQRPEGALAQLKHKRAAALHERALPKVRGPAPTAYEALAGPVATPPLAPQVQGPLYTAVAGGPTTIVPPTGGASGGPPILSDIPPPGGGGGGFTPPPITTQEVPPVTPTSPVPEPASWAMMILGFALLGRALSRRTAAGSAPALE